MSCRMTRLGLPLGAWCLTVVGAMGAVGCQGGELVTGPEPAERSVIVSDPAPILAAASGQAGASTTTTSAEVVFVSLPPGTVPGGQVATIQNPRTGSSLQIALVAGGFDPVAVPAVVGDTLHIEVSVTGFGGPIRFSRAVPPRRRPIVVRTDPPPGKRDVPLNASLVIVFSEPIDPQTLTGTSIQLLLEGTPVPGRLEVREPERLVAEFVPAQRLVATTDYELVITPGVRDLDGEALEGTVIVAFTTELRLPPPSGDQIAFVSVLSGIPGISLVNADGSGLVRLSGDPGAAMDPAWSPDGTRLAYRSDRHGKRDGSDTRNNWDIYILGPGGQRRLTSDTASDEGPSWSPDGTRITFIRSFNSFPSVPSSGWIHVASADASVATKLTDLYDTQPTWSPDGRRVLFERQDIDDFWGGPTISVMNADGSDVARLSYGFDPAWAPDGARIAYASDFIPYASWEEGDGLFVMNADGSGNTWLTRGPGYVSNPRWSPDGTKIAFVGKPNCCTWGLSPGEVYVINADGSGLIRVTPGGPLALYPAWSPDGRKIAFAGSFDGRWEIYVVNADGSGLTRLTHSPFGVPNWGPVWRPRGQQ